VKISACLIAKNEENNITRCLESVRDISDEIILVDTGSSDRTVEIGRSFGAKIYYYDWNNNFAEARNFALEQATGDWIIFLDADEYFVSSSLSNVRTCIERNDHDREIDAISCRINHLSGSNNKIISRHITIRIFRNLPLIRYHGNIHEYPRNNGKPLHAALYDFLLEIYHTGYDEKVIGEKIIRNLEILERNIKDDNIEGLTYYYLSSSYHVLGRHAQAVNYARLSLECGNVEETIFAYKPYVILVSGLLALGHKLTEIKPFVEEAMVKYPDHPEIWRLQAIYHDLNNDYPAALEAFLKALSANNEYKGTLNNDFFTLLHEALAAIGRLYYMKNCPGEALEYFVAALRQEKYYEDAFMQLIGLIKEQSAEEIVYFLNSIYDRTMANDVEFLVSQLVKMKLPKVLSYYQYIRGEQWGRHDIYEAVTLLANLQYRAAFEYFSALLAVNGNKDAEVMAIVTIMIADCPEWQKEVEQYVNHAYLRILAVWFDPEGVRELLQSDEASAYLALFAEFIALANPKQVERLLSIKNRFKANISYELGLIYWNWHEYSAALDEFQSVHSSLLSKESAIISFKIGLCWYKLKSYKKAVDYFTLALKEGYPYTEVFSYIDWILTQCNDKELLLEIKELREKSWRVIRLNLGCGRDIKRDWVNLDCMKLPGVDVVANLDDCLNNSLPFSESSVHEIYASHLIEHIRYSLPLMQELYRIAKPDAKATFRLPYGSSDEAFEDPTHVKQYFLNSFGYFSQPFYWRADYGYRGDWQTEKIILVLDGNKYRDKSVEEISFAVHNFRNVVLEMIVELRAIKPIRQPLRELQVPPKIEYQFTESPL
jgi:glycosyltransferase involved in cell wall biosynthesis